MDGQRVFNRNRISGGNRHQTKSRSTWWGLAALLSCSMACAPNYLTAAPVTPTDSVSAATTSTIRAATHNAAEDAVPHPGDFRGITPGKSTILEMRKTFGVAQKEDNTDDAHTFRYKVRPYDTIDVETVDDIVTAVVLYPNEPEPMKDVVSEYDLGGIDAVFIENKKARTVGAVYPERGLIVTFSDDTKKDVSEIILHPLEARPFVLRAKARMRYAYSQQIADLESAVAFASPQPEAYGTLAYLYNLQGNYDHAREMADKAIALDRDNSRYSLELAVARLGSGDFAAGRKLLQELADSEDAAAHVRASALQRLGRLTTHGQYGNYRKAVKYHQAAIAQATTAVDTDDPLVRREAISVLIDAHLSMAANIAWGPWPKKDEVVSTWLKQAIDLTDAYITKEGGDPRYNLRCYAGVIAALEPLPQDNRLDQKIDDALHFGRQQISVTTDPIRKKQLRSELGNVLYQAMKTRTANGLFRKSIQHGNAAIPLLKPTGKEISLVGQDAYRLGRVYFAMGVAHALFEDDHETAVRWYDKSLDEFAKAPVVSPIQRGLHGDRFVSMGVSYWEINRRKEAIELTELGVDLIQEAVDQAGVQRNLLAIPHLNLSEMYEQAGDGEQARLHREMAMEAEPERRSASRGLRLIR